LRDLRGGGQPSGEDPAADRATALRVNLPLRHGPLAGRRRFLAGPHGVKLPQQADEVSLAEWSGGGGFLQTCHGPDPSLNVAPTGDERDHDKLMTTRV
jgi:hypothetical protein